MNPTTTQQAAGAAPDIQFRLRIARLLAELHGETVLSEQQCAKYMDIDLVSWRRLVGAFVAGVFVPEGQQQAMPAENSETILRAALGFGGTDSGAAPADMLSHLKNLTISTFNRHYAMDAHYVSGESKWEPCDDMAGLLSQLDNMLTGLTRSVPAAPDTVPAASGLWIERWYGSGGKPGLEGWSILDGRTLVAYLGREVESGAVTAIVMAHNADRAARTQPVAAPLTDVERTQLAAAVADFDDAGETDVPYETLMRFAALGLLECEHFRIMHAARKAIAEATGIGQERSTS